MGTSQGGFVPFLEKQQPCPELVKLSNIKLSQCRMLHGVVQLPHPILFGLPVEGTDTC